MLGKLAEPPIQGGAMLHVVGILTRMSQQTRQSLRFLSQVSLRFAESTEALRF